jgi:hypothetical protein
MNEFMILTTDQAGEENITLPHRYAMHLSNDHVHSVQSIAVGNDSVPSKRRRMTIITMTMIPYRMKMRNERVVTRVLLLLLGEIRTIPTNEMKKRNIITTPPPILTRRKRRTD